MTPPAVADRHRYALAHPLSRADAPPETLATLASTRRHVTGLLLRTILAVDR